MVGSAQNSQRKAWNEAMRSAAGASIVAMHQGQKRRSDRRRKQDRRDKARKVEALGIDNIEYRSALWMDALEEVDPAGQAAEEEEEYDALEELDETPRGGKRKRGGGRKGPNKAVKAGVIPKRFKPRSLGTMLMEEGNREDSVSKAFLDAEARVTATAQGKPHRQQLPPRKFCPVTGLVGVYTEPKSGIPFANLKALEQIRERAPPWMTLGGTPTYWEACKSLRDED